MADPHWPWSEHGRKTPLKSAESIAVTLGKWTDVEVEKNLLPEWGKWADVEVGKDDSDRVHIAPRKDLKQVKLEIEQKDCDEHVLYRVHWYD